jgi:hypothetical protein
VRTISFTCETIPGKAMFAIIKETSTILKRVICSSYRYHTSVWCLSRGYCRSIRRVVTPLTARNFNPVIAMAAGTVIASADNIVPVGMLSPDHVVTPAPVVDYLVAN